MSIAERFWTGTIGIDLTNLKRDADSLDSLAYLLADNRTDDIKNNDDLSAQEIIDYINDCIQHNWTLFLFEYGQLNAYRGHLDEEFRGRREVYTPDELINEDKHIEIETNDLLELFE